MMIIPILIFVLILLILLLYYNSTYIQLDKKFYEPNEVSSHLNKIYNYDINEIKKESLNLSDWLSWPEQYLYDSSVNKNGTWEVIPFYGFGIWVETTCNECPTITRYLKNIKGLKLATLSKLSPNMKLIPHRGWANHSNYVIRCHFGIVVPSCGDKCYVSVKNDEDDIEEVRFHKENEWTVFDDSKIHYAENGSDFDRIVLIIDIERPNNIKRGISNEQDSKELLDFIEQFKKFKLLN